MRWELSFVFSRLVQDGALQVLDYAVDQREVGFEFGNSPFERFQGGFSGCRHTSIIGKI